MRRMARLPMPNPIVHDLLQFQRIERLEDIGLRADADGLDCTIRCCPISPSSGFLCRPPGKTNQAQDHGLTSSENEARK